MYIPSHFEVTDRPVIERFIQENSFATIISVEDGRPLATHIPIELEVNGRGEKVLWGHMSRANPQWKTFSGGGKVLAVFLAPVSHYISSSWYDYVDAPTWNYMSVHVSGHIRLLEGEEMKESLRRLMAKHERGVNQSLELDDLPDDVLLQLNGLRAFEIAIEEVEAVFKLSQNRDDDNYQRIIASLRELGDVNSNLMADVLENNRKNH